jgi:tetratricopeptide (TPR) repeat protein
VQLGIARLNRNDLDGADIASNEALKIDPRHDDGKLGLARIPLKNRGFAAAEQAADDVLAIAPEHAEAWFIKASAMHAQGRFDDAATAYSRAHGLNPEHLQAALGEASALLEARQPRMAAALLKPLRDQYPSIATIPYLESEALRAMGRAQEADQVRAIASNIIGFYSATDLRHRPADLLLFGTIAFESEQFETAFQLLSVLVDVDGRNVQARKMLGKTLLAMGKPGDAQRILNRIAANEQADAETLALLGDSNIQLGDYAAADRYYRDALANHNGGPAIVRRLGMTQFHRGQRDTALQTLQAMVDRTEGAGKADTSLLLGMLYFTENRLSEAGALADGLAADNPDNLTARNLQAVIAIARRDPRTGRRILEDILARDASFRPAIYNLIKLDIAEDRYAPAAAALDRLLTTDPNDVRALLEAARFARARDDDRTAANSPGKDPRARTEKHSGDHRTDQPVPAGSGPSQGTVTRRGSRPRGPQRLPGQRGPGTHATDRRRTDRCGDHARRIQPPCGRRRRPTGTYGEAAGPGQCIRRRHLVTAESTGVLACRQRGTNRARDRIVSHRGSRRSA